jgi:hypothetical protein
MKAQNKSHHYRYRRHRNYHRSYISGHDFSPFVKSMWSASRVFGITRPHLVKGVRMSTGDRVDVLRYFWPPVRNRAIPLIEQYIIV